MDYELTKKLKHAGFPLPEYPETLIGTRGSEPLKLKGIIQEPTLSELIEACGTMQLNVYDDAGYSQALSNKMMGEGKTPEEAVARLWLKLNE